jgi:hypothetical protein
MTWGQTSNAWVARVSSSHVAAVAPLRNEPGLQVCEDATGFWICHTSRHAILTDALTRRLRLEIGAELFHVDANGQLTPWGKRVPTAVLPTAEWLPLTKSFAPQVPLARYGGPRPTPLPLRLLPCKEATAPTLIRCPLSVWKRFVCTAPQLRLSRWEFAAASNGDVVVRGTPLPTLLGQHYWETSRLIIPCGWTWFPTVSAAVVREVLKLNPEDYAIACEATSIWSIIRANGFVSARRENVHATVMEISTASEGTS